jgi:DNA-directed RNA polymerase subunit L
MATQVENVAHGMKEEEEGEEEEARGQAVETEGEEQVTQKVVEDENDSAAAAEHTTGILTWLVREDRHVVVQVSDEDFTTMRSLQSFLLKDPKVVFASCKVSDKCSSAIIEVMMASTGIVSASAAIIKALMQVAVECRKFTQACQDAVPRF